MSRRKKAKEPKLSRGKIIDPVLLRARNLRASLLKRVKDSVLKESTPTIPQLEKWLRLPHYTCYYCLKSLVLEEFQVDHKTPLAKGGNNLLDNLCVACCDCNAIKGEFTETQYREIIELTKSWPDQGAYLFTRLKRGNTIFRR